MTKSPIDLKGLTKKEGEIAHFVNLKFDATSPTSVEFVDVGLGLAKIVEKCFEEESTTKKQSPWALTPPALTKTSKLLVRYFEKGSYVIRVVEAHEILRLAACNSQYFTNGFGDGTASVISLTEGAHKYASMSISVHQYTTLVMGFTACAGRYALGPDEADVYDELTAAFTENGDGEELDATQNSVATLGSLDGSE